MAPKFQAGETVLVKDGPFKGAIGKIRFSTKLEDRQTIYYAVRLLVIFEMSTELMDGQQALKKESRPTVYLPEDYLKKERRNG